MSALAICTRRTVERGRLTLWQELFAQLEASLIMQRRHRINFHGSSCRDVAGKQCNSTEKA
jgi:hypothetical protein